MLRLSDESRRNPVGEELGGDDAFQQIGALEAESKQKGSMFKVASLERPGSLDQP